MDVLTSILVLAAVVGVGYFIYKKVTKKKETVVPTDVGVPTQRPEDEQDGGSTR